MRQVAIFRSTNGKNTHWLDTSIPASSLYTSDWPKSLQSSYVTNISLPLNHFNIHLNHIQSPWRWRQHIPLKCPSTPIIRQSIKTKQTIISASSFIIFNGLQRKPNASSVWNVCIKLLYILNLQNGKSFTQLLNLTQTEEKKKIQFHWGLYLMSHVRVSQETPSSQEQTPKFQCSTAAITH